MPSEKPAIRKSHANRRPPLVRLRYAPHPDTDFRLPNPSGVGEGCRYARPRDGRPSERRNQGFAEGEKRGLGGALLC